MLFEEGPLVGVGHPALREATARALAVVFPKAVVGAVAPRPLARSRLTTFTARASRGAVRLALRVGGGTPQVVGAPFARELAVHFGMLGRESTLAAVGAVVAPPGVVVGVVHPDRGTPRRLLHVGGWDRVGLYIYAGGRRRPDVRVVHEPPGRTLATEVEVADSLLAQGRGLMFRRSVPDDYALVFPFGRVGRRGLHMVFVPFDIDAVWLVEGEVRRVKRLSAWTGHGAARADTVVEMPAGAADGVAEGDRVRVEE